jgi:hypothetical protein
MVILFFKFIMSSSIFAVEMGSSAEVGSSKKRTSGSCAGDLAIQSLCLWPPERLNPDSLGLSFTSSQRAAQGGTGMNGTSHLLDLLNSISYVSLTIFV